MRMMGPRGMMDWGLALGATLVVALWALKARKQAAAAQQVADEAARALERAKAQQAAARAAAAASGAAEAAEPETPAVSGLADNPDPTGDGMTLGEAEVMGLLGMSDEEAQVIGLLDTLGVTELGAAKAYYRVRLENLFVEPIQLKWTKWKYETEQKARKRQYASTPAGGPWMPFLERFVSGEGWYDLDTGKPAPEAPA